MLAVALVLVIALTAHCSADRDDQTSEEDALIESLLSRVTAQGQDILSAIQQQLSELQDEEKEPSIQDIEESLIESQEKLVDQGNEDPGTEGSQDNFRQGLEDSLSKLQDDEEDSNAQDLLNLLASVQDEEDENEMALSSLALAQDRDDNDIARLQALQKLFEATLQDTNDHSTKRACVQEQTPAQSQWWWRRSRKRHYYNHQQHYYNAFVNVARNYLRYTHNNKRNYEKALRRHVDRSYKNFIAKMNSYFKDLYKKIEANIPRYVQTSKDAKAVLKDFSHGGKKLPSKAIIIEEPKKMGTSKQPSKKPAPKKVKG